MKQITPKKITTLLLVFYLNFSYSQLQTDSMHFQFQDEKFSSNEKLNFFKSNFGYIISYPEKWERDKRTTDNLIFYLRKPNEKNTFQFIEMVTILREQLEDSTKTLKEYANMQNNIAADTWLKYNMEYTIIDESFFQLNGMQAIQIISELEKIAQKKLIVLFIKNDAAYKIEFTATQVTYAELLREVRCMINTFAFVE